MNELGKKVKAKSKGKIKLIILGTITLILFVVTIYATTNYSLDTVVESATYDVRGDLTYSICYKQNDFVSEKCFSDDSRSYINSLIQEILINFKYSIQVSQKVDNLNYKLKITAETVATEKNNSDRILYSETETLFEDEKTLRDYSLILVDETVNVDFQKYNQIITEFKKQYVLSMDSKLIIRVSIGAAGIHEYVENPEVGQRELQLIFPLAEQTVNLEKINTSFKKVDTRVIYDKMPVYSIDTIILLVIYVIDTIVLGMWIYVIVQYQVYANSFKGKVKKLLKQYDRAIVKIENFPDIKNTKIIIVSKFEELLDVRDNLNKPILYYGDPKLKSAKFIIMNDKETYLFEMGAGSKDEK